MRRTSLAVLLAAPLLLAFPARLPAHPPSQCFGPFGGGGFCLGCFSKLHQHGPLFNYGPYYGYPPFEPYGPWNAYLQYNPWYYGSGGGGGGGFGHGGLFHGHFGGLGCAGCGHASWLHGGWFHGHGCLTCGLHGLFHHGGGRCSNCTADAGPADTATRFAGAGAPRDSAAFYAGLPTLDAEPAGGIR